jgi:hypothetical protein
LTGISLPKQFIRRRNAVSFLAHVCSFRIGKTNAYRVLVGKFLGIWLHGRPRRCEDNIMLDLTDLDVVRMAGGCR